MIPAPAPYWTPKYDRFRLQAGDGYESVELLQVKDQWKTLTPGKYWLIRVKQSLKC